MNTQATQLEQTKNAIKQYIAQQFLYDKPEMSLTDDFPLIQQGLVDSLQIIQLISFVQEHFTIEFEVEELMLENFSSINAIAALLQKHRTASMTGG